jgi:VWFA-related protein
MRFQAIGRGLVATVALAMAAAGAAAQQLTFGETVEVRVVNLEIEVSDRDGFPVTGLAPADFELTVDGERVPVRYFTEIRAGIAVAPRVAGSVEEVPALVAGEPVGTSYLVFVDDFFPLARDRDRVLEALRADVGRLKPEDRMAIVAFDGEQLAMLTSWTNAPRELERALREAVGRPAYGLRRVAERRSLRSDRAAARGFPGLERVSRLDTRLDVSERHYAELLEQQLDNVVSAVTAALRGFANPPGRKVLLLLSGGWPYDVGEHVANAFGRAVNEPGIRRGEQLYAAIADTANQVGYTVFTVDVPGLGAEGLADAELDSVPADGERFAAFLRENNQQYTLQRLAADTGGRALLDSRRLDALAAAEAATRSYYWIGFVPAWQGDDGRHAVSVRVLREGLRTRGRSGYVDFSRSREVTAAVESVLLFGSGPGLLPLALEVGRPTFPSARVMRVPIALELPTAELTLLPTADGAVAELELRVAAVDDRGGRSEIPVVPMRVVVGADRHPAAKARYMTQLELRRAPNRFVVAVYDPVSGNLWSATAEVKP